jgi:hypothetical protein
MCSAAIDSVSWWTCGIPVCSTCLQAHSSRADLVQASAASPAQLLRNRAQNSRLNFLEARIDSPNQLLRARSHIQVCLYFRGFDPIHRFYALFTGEQE